MTWTAGTTYYILLDDENTLSGSHTFYIDYIVSQEKTLGNTEIYSLTSTTANRRAQTITFTEAGAIQSISMYHNGGTGHVLLGVYADAGGVPGARLGVTPATTISSSAGWQTISLESTVSVTTGQKVWLLWVFQNNPGIRYKAGTPARAQSPSLWSGGMPDPFGSSSLANYRYSIYCTYTVSSGDEVKSVNEPVDVNELYQLKEEVLIYPNPTDGEITVRWNNSYGNRLNITIYNILGKAIKEVQTDPDDTEISLDIGATKSGIYIFEMKDQKNDLVINRSRIIKR